MSNVGIKNDRIVFDFTHVHPDAILEVEFQRTLRMPDDGKEYGLPPGRGCFPLKAVDELKPGRAPEAWTKRGGVVLPMHRTEAMWINFRSPSGYLFLVKIASGKVNAVTGKPWSEAPDFADQDFLELPKQRWLDGFNTGKDPRGADVIRQFVAVGLDEDADFTVEKQVTGEAEHGGVQILVYPIRATAWEQRKPRFQPRTRGGLECFTAASYASSCASMGFSRSAALSVRPDMGLAAGAKIRQKIVSSDIPADEWDLTQKAKCFVALANAMSWMHLTGQQPPTVAPTAADYAAAGLPFWDYQPAGKSVGNSEILDKVKSIAELSGETGKHILPENESFDPQKAVTIPVAPVGQHLAKTGAKILGGGDF